MLPIRPTISKLLVIEVIIFSSLARIINDKFWAALTSCIQKFEQDIANNSLGVISADTHTIQTIGYINKVKERSILIYILAVKVQRVTNQIDLGSKINSTQVISNPVCQVEIIILACIRLLGVKCRNNIKIVDQAGW